MLMVTYDLEFLISQKNDNNMHAMQNMHINNYFLC